MTYLFCSITILLVVETALAAQVTNNNITSRTELKLDDDCLHSNTANSSVEWRCVNKALTNKCLTYHNDQWFHFTTGRSGKFFLNISAQHCRDLQGIQLVVIEGNPCEINTYKILKCISRIHYDDVFVELDSLKKNTLYLVNIDGFLGDFCEFEIQLGSSPRGLPQLTHAMDTLNLSAEVKKGIVRLQWHADQSLVEGLDHFEIYFTKSGELKSRFKTLVPTKSNTLGRYVEDYFYIDTLTSQGEYQYKVIGVDIAEGNRVLLDQAKIKFKPDEVLSKKVLAKIPLSFTQNGRVEVFVMNSNDTEILNYWVHDYAVPETLFVELTKFVDAGIREFQIKTRHNKTRETRGFYFHVNEFGEVVLVEK